MTKTVVRFTVECFSLLMTQLMGEEKKKKLVLVIKNFFTVQIVSACRTLLVTSHFVNRGKMFLCYHKGVFFDNFAFCCRLHRLHAFFINLLFPEVFIPYVE